MQKKKKLAPKTIMIKTPDDVGPSFPTMFRPTMDASNTIIRIKREA
jgi:hypothetical protein